MQTTKFTTKRRFNTTGACNPARHYMVDITKRLEEIRRLIDDGEYFTINRARQYGKTTTIAELERFIKEDYIVLSLDFQMISGAKFANEHTFAVAFADYVQRIVYDVMDPVKGLDDSVLQKMERASNQAQSFDLVELFTILSELCYTAEKPIVLIIDEVDSATNNQVFLDFLAQLRAYYIARSKKNLPTFQSVIFAGLYDVKNIRRKIRSDEEHKINSPWNIAADFDVNMSLTESGICGMLQDYEVDHHTGMDSALIAKLLYEYTSGYPFLVSRLCKLIDEKVAGSAHYPKKADAWTKSGFLEAVKMLLIEKNTLFESLMGKLEEYPELKSVLYATLFGGEKIVYNPDNSAHDIAAMFGFIKSQENILVVANRIFEIRLYNYFLSIERPNYELISQSASQDKSQFKERTHAKLQF